MLRRAICRLRGHVIRHNAASLEPIDDYGYPGHRPWECVRCGARCCP